MKIFQSTELSRDPTAPMEAATKKYVDEQITSGVSGAIVGALFFTNAAPASSGIVADKQYVPGTVPVNKVISQATSDTENVTVTLFAEGGASFYSPTVTITTDPPQPGGTITCTLSEDATDKRSYSATATLAISVNTTVTAYSTTNATATMIINRAGAGPAMDALLIGAIVSPAVGQTEVRSGQQFNVSGRVPNDATYAEILATGASSSVAVLSLGAADSMGTGFKMFTGVVTVGGGTGALTVTGRARNALGTYGANFVSTNTITLNQTFPSIGTRTVSYPGGQLALKASESGTVSSTITNFDTVVYSATNLSVTDPTTYGVAKTVTRTGGTYSFGTQNYTITATKTSNNATSTATAAVNIADVAPTAAITIVGSPSRLFSLPAGQDYVVTITANQQLASAPSLDASSGTWQGSWSGSGTTWTRTLRIFDSSPKGSQTFSNLSVTGLAGLIGSTITSGAAYDVGGFALRTITFPAFARYAPIGTSIVTFSKVQAWYTGSVELTRYGDTGDYFQGFSIVDSAGNFDPNGTHLFISDAAFAGSNTSGTLQLDIRENA